MVSVYAGIAILVFLAEILGRRYAMQKLQEDRELRERYGLKLRGGVPVFGNRVQICHLENPGMAGGSTRIPQKHHNMLSAVFLGILFGLFFFRMLRESEKKVTMEGISLVLMMAGGLQNLMQRIHRGTVTDYIRFPKSPVKRIRNLVFNISDFALIIGFVIYLIENRIFSGK